VALVGVTVIASILASLASFGAPAALADGDPASDVLVNMTFFNPIDSGISFATIDRLQQVLAESDKAGFHIRVAMINSPADLGTVTALWDKPARYAQYLSYELSTLYQGQILVVMPNGFGLYGPAHGKYAVTKAELGVHALSPGAGAGLAAAALSAVPLLAHAGGHSLSTGGFKRVSAPTAGSGPPLAGVIALVLGALLIAGCWRASLKARPLSFSRQAHP
jgi:hypothetical protein